MTRSSIQLAAFVGVPLTVMAACSRDAVIAEGPSPNAASFGSADAGDGDIDSSLPEQLMCPVTTCQLPWTTCPSSEVHCGTNLLTDDDNCGACGVRCAGEDPTTHSKWTCVKGQCTFSCEPFRADCDDDVTNGCESWLEVDRENCGSCGNKCEPPFGCTSGQCQTCEMYNLHDTCDGMCTNLMTAPTNCGTCGNVCDNSGLPPLPSGMLYACRNGLCGQPTCTGFGLNCNGDLSDGCEARRGTNEHCGDCYDACPEGKPCILVTETAYHCGCLDEDATACGGACFRLEDDPGNCGGCFNRCPGYLRPHFEATCTFGACGGKCEANYADCDQISENGCEVNTFVDNRNCGACGNACLPNQVCSQGTCLVAPCDAGTPGDPTQ